MNKTTIVLKIPTHTTDGVSLTDRLQGECDLKWAAGYRLASTLDAGDGIICVFQPKEG